MADMGTFANAFHSFKGVESAPYPFTFTWAGEREYDYGVFDSAVEMPPSGGGIQVVYQDRTLYNDPPLATDAPGDHGMTFFAGKLPVENTSQAEPYPEILYVPPAGCRAYVRAYRLYNNTAVAQQAILWFRQMPIFDGIIEPGITFVGDGLWVLGPGEEIEGQGPPGTDTEGVWCWLSGVLEVS